MPSDQIVLGFDFGMKRIGVAVGQTLTKTARPLQTLSALQGEPNWAHVAKLIKEWKPNALVVGMPLNMDGTKQTITFAAEQFIEQLKHRFALPVHAVDERLTSVAAREQIFAGGGFKALKKSAVDSVAAQLIVESWLMGNF